MHSPNRFRFVGIVGRSLAPGASFGMNRISQFQSPDLTIRRERLSSN